MGIEEGREIVYPKYKINIKISIRVINFIFRFSFTSSPASVVRLIITIDLSRLSFSIIPSAINKFIAIMGNSQNNLIGTNETNFFLVDSRTVFFYKLIDLFVCIIKKIYYFNN